MDIPPYVLEVEPLDLGPDVKAVGLELVEVESREPVHGSDAARIWAAALLALPGPEPWVLDFFAHISRVQQYCERHAILFHEKSSGRLLVVPALPPEPLAGLLERFAGETFGLRAGSLVETGDDTVESELARCGVDGYRPSFRNYLLCAVCDLENGFLTLLTETLWASEVIRRIKPGLSSLRVEVTRPS
jgi:hypothetical protein